MEKNEQVKKSPDTFGDNKTFDNSKSRPTERADQRTTIRIVYLLLF